MSFKQTSAPAESDRRFTAHECPPVQRNRPGCDRHHIALSGQPPNSHQHRLVGRSWASILKRAWSISRSFCEL